MNHSCCYSKLSSLRKISSIVCWQNSTRTTLSSFRWGLTTLLYHVRPSRVIHEKFPLKVEIKSLFKKAQEFPPPSWKQASQSSSVVGKEASPWLTRMFYCKRFHNLWSVFVLHFRWGVVAEELRCCRFSWSEISDLISGELLWGADKSARHRFAWAHQGERPSSITGTDLSWLIKLCNSIFILYIFGTWY